jgi:hypothetical protein
MKKMKDHLMNICFAIVHVITIAILISVLGGCANVYDVKWKPYPSKTPKFDIYEGEMVVIWHTETGLLRDKEYIKLGGVGGRLRDYDCNTEIVRGDNRELEDTLIEEARKHGGNGIILKCVCGGKCVGVVIRILGM